MNVSMHEYLNNYIGTVGLPMLIYGEPVTAWAPAEAELIRIDCDEQQTWPGVAWRIVRGLQALCHTEFPIRYQQTQNGDLFFLEAAEQEQFRQALLPWLKEQRPTRKVCILINELDRLRDEETMLLSWLPLEAAQNLGLICTTKSTEMVKNGSILGWFTTEMGTPSPLSIRQDPSAEKHFFQIAAEPDSLHKKHTMRLLARNLVSNALDSGDLAALERLMTAPQVLAVLAPLDWSMIRTGWMHLLLHTDLDLVEKHLDLLEILDMGGNKDLIRAMARLSADLHFQHGHNRLIHYTGKVMRENSLEADLSVHTEEFRETCRRFQKLLKRRDHRSLLKEIQELLSKTTPSPAEMCRILHFRVEASWHLRTHSLLTDANAYYETALQCGQYMDVHYALRYLGDALYLRDHVEEALEVYCRSEILSKRIGHLYGLLEARNNMAMCLKKLGRHEETIPIYRGLRDDHAHLENRDPYLRRWMDLAEALHQCGRHADAIAEAEAILETITDQDHMAIRALRTEIKARIGRYLVELKEYDRAIAILSDTLHQTWRREPRSKAFQALIIAYDRSGSPMKAAIAYRQELTFWWQQRDYDDLLKILWEAMAYFQEHGLTALAHQIQHEWLDKLCTLNDLSYCRQIFDRMDQERHLVQQYDAQMRQAISEEQWSQAAQFARNAAFHAYGTDCGTSAAYLLKAYELHSKAEEDSKALQALEEAVSALFQGGKVLDPKLFDQFLALQGNEPIKLLQNLAQQWGECGRFLPHNNDIPDLSQRTAEILIDRFYRILSFGPTCPKAVVSVLIDLGPLVLAVFSSEELDRLLDGMEENCSLRLSVALGDYILKCWTQVSGSLFRSPKAAESVRIAQFLLAGARFMDLRGDGRTGPLCGELSLLLREMQKPHWAVQCHEMAIHGFSASDQKLDRYKQYENFVDTYVRFEMLAEATELLKKVLNLVLDEEMPRYVAIFAGRLAKLMIQDQNASRKDIDLLFELQLSKLREAGSNQDLIQALLDQAEYYGLKPFREAEFLTRIEDAQQLLRWYAAPQQEERLQGMERIIRLSRRKVAERVYFGLLKVLPEYTVRDIRRVKEDGFHVICGLVKSPEELHIMVMIGPGGTVRQVGLITTAPLPPAYKEEMATYVQRWNREKVYSLELLTDQGLLQAIWTPKFEEIEEMRRKALNFLSLWAMDVSQISLLSTGEITPEEAIQRKLECPGATE